MKTILSCWVRRHRTGQRALQRAAELAGVRRQAGGHERGAVHIPIGRATTGPLDPPTRSPREAGRRAEAGRGVLEGLGVEAEYVPRSASPRTPSSSWPAIARPT